MGNSLVTDWKEDPTPAFLVSKRSKSHQFLAIAFCMNSQQTFRKKNIQKRSLQMASPSNWQFSRIFFSSFLSKVGLDSSILIVHALNTKRSFYPEKSHFKRAASVWLRAVGAEGALCVEMGFYADISWESRCNIEINVWAHFYKLLLVFEVPYWPRVKWMPGKS